MLIQSWYAIISGNGIEKLPIDNLVTLRFKDGNFYGMKFYSNDYIRRVSIDEDAIILSKYIFEALIETFDNVAYRIRIAKEENAQCEKPNSNDTSSTD